MTKWKKLSHTIYQCKYHIVFCPKYRYRILKDALAEFVKPNIRMLCEWKIIEILEINVKDSYPSHTLCFSQAILVSELMGILKGKTAIKIFKSFPLLKKKPYWGNHFWSRGYCVSTIGLDESKIRKYIQYQEDREGQEEIDEEEFGLF